jgi:hypothetical protein
MGEMRERSSVRRRIVRLWKRTKMDYKSYGIAIKDAQLIQKLKTKKILMLRFLYP